MNGQRRGTSQRMVAALAALATATTLSACSLVDRGEDGTAVSVFDVHVGQCFLAPQDITVELSTLAAVDCTEPHEQEAYALAAFTAPGTDTAPDDFPGEAALKEFAEGTCAERFADYVGVDYRDSELYFTYLVPSPRGWEQDGDRTTLCFVTTTGAQLTQSVAGTGW